MITSLEPHYMWWLSRLELFKLKFEVCLFSLRECTNWLLKGQLALWLLGIPGKCKCEQICSIAGTGRNCEVPVSLVVCGFASCSRSCCTCVCQLVVYILREMTTIHIFSIKQSKCTHFPLMWRPNGSMKRYLWIQCFFFSSHSCYYM